MIIVFDIGNTNIVAAIFNGDEILHQWRINTDTKKTADEYLVILKSLLDSENISFNCIEDAAVSSVVPDLTGPIISVCTKICGKKPVILSSTTLSDERIPVKIESGTNELGTDLLCNSVYAATRYSGKASIVVDFGTALTMIVTDDKKIIRGVTISPGLKTAVHSLSSNTAQLPVIPLTAPESSLGLNTIQSIQSGIILGYKGLVEFLVKSLKDDLQKVTGIKGEDVIVIATGGLNSVLKPITEIFDYVEKNLTILGLKEIYNLLRK